MENRLKFLKALLILNLSLCCLTSSAAFAETFICKNWEGELFANADGEIDGTMMIGKIKGKTLEIKNSNKNKKVLNYMGKFNDTGVSLWSSISDNNHVSIFAVSTSVTNYDFSITEMAVLKQAQTKTYCNYQ